MESSPLKIVSPESTHRSVPWEPETYHRLFLEAPMGLYRVLEDGRIAEANPALLSLLGCSSRDELRRLDWKDLYRSPEAWRQRTIRLRRAGVVRGLEFQMRRRDGSLCWVRESCRLRHLPDGTALYEGCLEDISPQVQTRQQLEQTHDELSLVLQSISSILIGIGSNERINRWNSEAEKAFGIPEKDALGQPLSAVGGLPEFQAICRSAPGRSNAFGQKELAPEPLEVRFRRPDGSEGIFGFSLSVLEGRRGCLIVGRDITVKKQLESQAQQTRKLEAIGQLAAGIAHEINTPTQYVGDNLHFLKDAFEDLLRAVSDVQCLVEQHSGLGKGQPDWLAKLHQALQEADLEYLKEEVPEAIRQSLKGVDRISRIVLAIRDFSHPGSSEKAPVDLNRIAEASLTVSRGLWKHVAEVETDLDPELPPVPGLAGELSQVMLNLIVNAAQALEETAARHPGKGRISVATCRRGDAAEIRVSDNGPGIPEEVQPCIFDPFFTTKEVGKGTGQGLAIAHKVVVQDHGGMLHFETHPGQGTAFVVSLPLKESGGQGREAG